MPQTQAHPPVYITALIVLLICFSAQISSSEHLISGRIQRSDGVGLDGIRIQIDLTDEDGQKKLTRAIYTRSIETELNKAEPGHFSLILPHFHQADLSISGRGCKPNHRRLTPADLNSDPLVITVTSDLNHLLPYSLDLAQLFVPPLSQEEIECHIELCLTSRPFLLTISPPQLRVGLDMILQTYEPVSALIRSQISEGPGREWAQRFAGHLLLTHGQFGAAERFFTTAHAPVYALAMGNKAYLTGNEDLAIHWYRRSGHSSEKARNLFKISDRRLQKGDIEQAVDSLALARNTYQALSNVHHPEYEDSYIMKWIECQELLDDLNGTTQPQDPFLEQLLRMAAHYCRELDSRSYKYFCKELKTDKVVLKPALIHFENRAFPELITIDIKTESLFYDMVYTYSDIQVVKTEDGRFEEDRKEISRRFRNQKRELSYRIYTINMSVFGPGTLIGKEAQSTYKYTVLRYESLFGQEAAVVQAIPKVFNPDNTNMGKIWLSKKDGSVLKIEWDNPMLPTKTELRRWGMLLNLLPQVRYVTEYDIEKMGFRYPSKVELTESYQDADGRDRWTYLDTQVKYNAHRFFSVGSRYSLEKMK